MFSSQTVENMSDHVVVLLQASSELCLIRSIPNIRPIQHQIIVRNQADTTCFPDIPEIKSNITPEQKTSAIT